MGVSRPQSKLRQFRARRRLPAVEFVAAALVMSWCGAPFHSAIAQDAPPRDIQAVPFDDSAPDIQEFKSRDVSKAARGEGIVEQFKVPGDQMFAIINPQRATDVGKRSDPETTAKAAAAGEVACEVESVAWDPSGMRAWFQVNYKEPCNLEQYCNWVVDPTIDTADDIRAAEAELERKWAASPEDDKKAFDEDVAKAAAEDGESPDVHLNNYDQISREVILGGTRKCRLTRQCTGKDDPLCTKEFLDQKAAQIEIEQLGK